MSLATLSDRARFAGLLAFRGVNSTLNRLYTGRLYRWRFGGAIPDRLLIAPTDIRTADPTIAADIYAGLFVFCGQAVETDGRSPFEVTPPSEVWARVLHGFGWLRHLRAADRAISRSNARALVEDWIRLYGDYDAFSWRPEIVSRRILSWLAQSPIILQDADRAFYRRFMKTLMRQVRYLRYASMDLADGLPRLQAAIALTAAGLSISGQTRLIRQSAKRLDQEIARQILADGGHVSRNPAALPEILLDLLPLRQAFTAQSVDPPRAMQTAIDRMMPMIRFFRHGDGALAHFNGVGGSRSDLIALIFAYDDVRGSPVQNAVHSGYQRVTAGESVVIVDTGPPPPMMLSQHAHAGCLSFEMSAGANQIIVNCGASPETLPNWRLVARATAAHSTAVLNDTSSCRFITGGYAHDRLGPVIISGPRHVTVDRDSGEEGETLWLSHDGYAALFGIIHERRLIVSPDGLSVSGEDRFSASHGGAVRHSRDRFALRFHLHPSVASNPLETGARVHLVLGDGETWLFSAPGSEISIEESVYLSDIHGHRDTEQLVISGRASQTPAVMWSLRRIEAATNL